MTKGKKDAWRDESMHALYDLMDYLVRENADGIERWAKEAGMPLVPVQTLLLFKGQLLGWMKKSMMHLTMDQLREGLAEQFKVEYISWKLLAEISQPGYLAEVRRESGSPEALLGRLVEDAQKQWKQLEGEYEPSAHLLPALDWGVHHD